jgi:hypothetical protein
MDLYTLASMHGESLRQEAARARLVKQARESARPAGSVRVGLARWLVALATRIWPEAARNAPGAWSTMGGAR